MDIKNNLGLIESLLARANNGHAAPKQDPPPPPSVSSSTDIVSLSKEKLQGLRANASRLVSEEIEKIDNGFRRTQTFETPKGGKFTRIEEVTTDQDRSKRLVIQQNESGSTTILENILDRQVDGTFRRTQRFTNEIGETATNIEFNVKGNNSAQIFGLPASPTDKPPEPFAPVRGTQYDVVT
jgi:hypothetical protein